MVFRKAPFATFSVALLLLLFASCDSVGDIMTIQAGVVNITYQIQNDDSIDFTVSIPLSNIEDLSSFWIALGFNSQPQMVSTIHFAVLHLHFFQRKNRLGRYAQHRLHEDKQHSTSTKLLQ